MPVDFTIEYSKRTNDELLHLASARHSLTAEAATALDAELGRRNLSEPDLAKYQRFMKRQEQRDARHNRRRRTLGPFKYQLSWFDLLWTLATVALISFTYLALSSRYHVKPDWEDTGFIVTMTSVVIVIAIRGVFRRNLAFWVSFVMSSAVHLIVVHTWRQQVSNFSRGDGKLAILLGFGIFLTVYGFVRLLQRMLQNREFEAKPGAKGV